MKVNLVFKFDSNLSYTIYIMNNDKKYQNFGKQLKRIRLDAKKTIQDVSLAVELPIEQLKKMETGDIRPHQELIYLLANYYDLSKQTTEDLYNLAGYNDKSEAEIKEDIQNLIENFFSNKLGDASTIMFAFSEEMRERQEEKIALYTNETRINVSNNGMMIEFIQNNGTRKSSNKVVAKIGMSIEHAYRLRNTLNKVLESFHKGS